MSVSLDRSQRLLLLIFLGAVILAHAAAMSVTSPLWQRFFDNLHWTLGYLGGTLLSFSAWRRASTGRRRRLAWFTLGLASYVLGQALWDLQVAVGWNPFPGPSDVFFLLLGPAFIVGILSESEPLNVKTRSAIVLDMVGLAAASLAFALSVYLPHRGDSSALVTATMVAYPFVLLSAVGSLLVMTLALRWRPSRGLLLLGAALALTAWLWMRWNLMSLEGSLSDGSAFNGLFSYGALLLGGGAALWDPLSLLDPSSERIYFFLWNALPVLLAVGAGVALSLSNNLAPGVSAWVRAGSLVTALCAIARQSLSVIEREERRQAEASARASEERLRAMTEARSDAQRLEALGTLAGGVAHEFNNILMAVHSQLELAEPAVRDPEAHEALRLARSASTRGREVIRRILTFARQDHASQPALQPVDLAAAADEALRLLRPLLPASVGMQVEDHSDGAHALADPAHLNQVLVNLGLNAGQALGLRAGQVRFRLGKRSPSAPDAEGVPAGDYAELSVIDNGPGMDESVRRRIFEPFFSTKGPEKGNGLGLSVAHGLVLAMGGFIHCQSEPGRGAQFNVLLPLAQHPPAEPEAPVAEPAPRGDDDDGEYLVLDDELIIAYALQKLLQRMGHRAVAVADPAEALELLRRQPGRFSVLITDMSMPGLNGEAMLREARALDPALTVILSTGSVTSDRAGDGFDARLEKPYSAAQLESALQRARQKR